MAAGAFPRSLPFLLRQTSPRRTCLRRHSDPSFEQSPFQHVFRATSQCFNVFSPKTAVRWSTLVSLRALLDRSTELLSTLRDTLSSPVVDQPCNAKIVIPLEKLPSPKSRLQRHAFPKQCGILAFDGDATKNLNEHSATSFGKFRKKSLRQ